MPAQLTGALARLQKQIADFTLAQRTLALIGVAGLVLGAIALSTWMTRPTMTPLFANLAAEDASAIVDHLQSSGVAYELTDGGSTVMVPAAALYEQRLAVAAAGLPAKSDGVGYSLLDDMGMTSSEFQQQVTYQRALEGELARTVAAIQGVENASVRLALPEDSVFVETAADPTASVFVETARGVSLSVQQVDAIVHLVSAGVEGMAPADVAVVDASGTVLSAVGGSPTDLLSSGRTAEYETRVAANVQQMLDRLVGPGNAVVSVSAEMDWDQTARTSETFTPAEGVPPLSQTTSREEYTGGAGAPVGGVLGPDNIAVPAGAGTGEYLKENETVNNAVNRVTEQLTTAPGSVRRQSVSVVVSNDAGAALDMPALQAAVVAAAGVDPERGDVVSVQRLAFDATSAEAAREALGLAAEEAAADRQADLIRTGVIAGAILLTLILALITAARRNRRTKREAIDLGELSPVPTEPLALPEPETLVALPAPEPVDTVAMKRQDLMALAAEQPAEVAEALRGWLTAGSRR